MGVMCRGEDSSETESPEAEVALDSFLLLVMFCGMEAPWMAVNEGCLVQAGGGAELLSQGDCCRAASATEEEEGAASLVEEANSAGAVTGNGASAQLAEAEGAGPCSEKGDIIGSTAFAELLLPEEDPKV